MIFVTYNVQYKDGLSQNISASRYWNSDHYPSVGEKKKKKRQRFLKVSRVIILIDEKDRSTCNLKKKNQGKNSDMSQKWSILLRSV